MFSNFTTRLQFRKTRQQDLHRNGPRRQSKQARYQFPYQTRRPGLRRTPTLPRRKANKQTRLLKLSTVNVRRISTGRRSRHTSLLLSFRRPSKLLQSDTLSSSKQKMSKGKWSGPRTYPRQRRQPTLKIIPGRSQASPYQHVLWMSREPCQTNIHGVK